MRVITLEDHFSTPRDRSLVPPATGVRAATRRHIDDRVGFSVDEGLLDLGPMRIEHMDRAGIDFQVISLTSPGAQLPPADIAVPLAREANDLLHEAIRKHPTRFGGFAALPTADPAASVKELERCVTKYGFKGACVNGHHRGEFLDDKKHWGLFEACEALGVPFYLHPTLPPQAVMDAFFQGPAQAFSRAAWGFAMECGTHFLRIAIAGVLDRFPKLTIILGHFGEGIPFVLGRMNSHTDFTFRDMGLKKDLAGYMRENVVVTTSGNFSVPTFLCTYMTLGADNILFSVDWPYEKNEWGAQLLKQLPISEEDRAKIAYKNAERVLKL
jgi:predicted TIM-barrel fold metal-dependent hydrolase